MHLILPSSSHASCELLLRQGNPEYGSARRGFTYKWIGRREQRQRDVVDMTYSKKVCCRICALHHGVWDVQPHFYMNVFRPSRHWAKALLDIQASVLCLLELTHTLYVGKARSHTLTHIMGDAPFCHTFKHKDILKHFFYAQNWIWGPDFFLCWHKKSLCHVKTFR